MTADDLELCYLSVAEASARIARGELSPVALTEAVFVRIEATEPQINAYVRLMRSSALAEAGAAAERARGGARIGPLDGIPVAVKDLYDTAGVVTAAGTALYRERVPAEDATAVRRLREAGAVIVGKTNTHELAMGGTTNNKTYGPTRNPWDPARVPGGSSGGSGAALAAGSALAALGSDTGGSIRIPAAFCGVTGHKPTYGLVGRGGVVPLSLTLDHAGPMARSAEDCALLLEALAGPDPRDLDSAGRDAEAYAAAAEPGLAGLRLAVIPSLVEGSERAVAANFERSLGVLGDLGAEIGVVEPLAGYERDWRGAIRAIIGAEAASYVRAALATRPDAIAEPMRGRLQAGLELRAADYAEALEVRKQFEWRYEQALSGVDGYLVPTAPIVAEPIADDPETEAPPEPKFRNTFVFDCTRQPAVSVPNGFDADGLPTALMIAGGKFEDALVLRVARAVPSRDRLPRAAPGARGRCVAGPAAAARAARRCARPPRALARPPCATRPLATCGRAASAPAARAPRCRHRRKPW